ncbi:hypothetical protein SAMN05428957_102411 [Oryzisolibacter propanilivorax]|uniref:Uncharacterized protein n=1 Tax=Oryzisolibacter propanilivorax TaxID=1527607 RepID=A0A1G9QMS1_9BURK|nr:hypothetical protein SAMN05428957_102411 [Oryzisolibacter propanilivorax]
MRAELGHGALERTKVVDHGLVDEDVAVGQEQDALPGAALPQPPDDLERGVGLARAGGHDQQHALLALGDGLHGAVDGVELVVTRCLAGRVVAGGDLLLGRRPAFPGAVAGPQLRGRGQLVGTERALQHAIGQRGIAEDEACAIAGKAKRHVQQFGIAQRLRHSGARGMAGILGLQHGQGQVGLVQQHIVGTQDGGPVALCLLATHHHAAGAQRVFAQDVLLHAPAGALQRGRDEAVADVGFAELADTGGHRAPPWCCVLGKPTQRQRLVLRCGFACLVLEGEA